MQPRPSTGNGGSPASRHRAGILCLCVSARWLMCKQGPTSNTIQRDGKGNAATCLIEDNTLNTGVRSTTWACNREPPCEREEPRRRVITTTRRPRAIDAVWQDLRESDAARRLRKTSLTCVGSACQARVDSQVAQHVAKLSGEQVLGTTRPRGEPKSAPIRPLLIDFGQPCPITSGRGRSDRANFGPRLTNVGQDWPL